MSKPRCRRAPHAAESLTSLNIIVTLWLAYLWNIILDMLPSFSLSRQHTVVYQIIKDGGIHQG
jgi:hypothetical protein